MAKVVYLQDALCLKALQRQERRFQMLNCIFNPVGIDLDQRRPFECVEAVWPNQSWCFLGGYFVSLDL